MKRLCTALFLWISLVAELPAAITLRDAVQPPEKKEAGGPAQAAFDSFNAGLHIEAVRLARPLAEAGDGDALLLLGVAFETGSGVAVSNEAAIDHYRKAGDAGNAGARSRLAGLLLKMGEAAGRKEAEDLLKALAADGDGTAAFQLGEGALRGLFGGEPSFDGARDWWTLAAGKGDINAMLALGQLIG